MVSLILLSVNDNTVHIPTELFVGIIIFLLTGFMAFMTWLTKQVIKLAAIVEQLQSDVHDLKRER